MTKLRPRPYLSWSQLDLVEKSPEQYLELYLYGKKIPINRGMAKGKIVADSLETGIMTGDIETDLIISRLPKFEDMDLESRAIIKGGKGEEDIEILIKPDTAKRNKTGFKEYKTGQEMWTQKKVDEWGQITFYAMGMYLQTGKIPTDIELVHAETVKDSDGRLVFTGNIYRYKTQRSLVEILRMITRCRKAWKVIGTIYSEAII